MPEAIKENVSHIEEVALRALESWDGEFINTFQEMKMYTFNVALLSIFGKDEMFLVEELKQCYFTLEKCYNSKPVNIPGTLYHNSMKARQQLGHILSSIISSRRERNVVANDLLGSFMDSKEGLTDEQIADNVIGVIFAARDTTASVLTWIVKYLGENPSFLKIVTEEQKDIITSKETTGEKKSLTWSDTKRMSYTIRVIQETMRIASILSFNFREAVRKPYTISRQRERWNDGEHDKFLEALRLYGCSWCKIEDFEDCTFEWLYWPQAHHVVIHRR